MDIECTQCGNTLVFFPGEGKYHCTFCMWKEELSKRIAAEAKLGAVSAERDRLLKIAYSCGYEAGHEDTVEARFNLDMDSMAEDWLSEARNDGTLTPDPEDAT